MNTTKRIYSINLGAYVMATTNLIPELLLDEESQTYLKAYFEAGNSALVCYNGEKTKMSEHDYSNNYLKISVAQISITYEDGGVVYRYNGSTWEKCEVYYYDGSAWVRVQPYYGTANGWERI